jgi:hypothetical protein
MHADSFHEDVCSQAARALPGCVVSAQAQLGPSPQLLSGAAQAICNEAAAALLLTASTSADRSVVASCLSAMTEVLNSTPAASLSQDHRAQVVASLLGVCSSGFCPNATE